MPKKSIDKNPITIQSNQGSDSSSSDITLISGLDTSVVASDVVSSNELGGYLGVDVQVNLDDLSSEVKNNQPPRVGFEPITFSNDTDTITHDGRPDWGQAKIIDVPPWESVRKKWVSQYEMPHWGVGKRYDDPNSTNSNAKYVNENGAYDTINLNYRDNSDLSYYGLRIVDSVPTFMTDTPQDVQVGFPHIAQSVPRSVFKTGLKNESIYPFLYQKPFIPEETTRDIFNTSSYTLGFNAGEGTSSLGVKDGQPSVSLSSPFSTELFDPRDSDSIIDASEYNSPVFDVGITLSGLLFPADRGVLALIRFSSENNDVAQSFNNVSSTTVDEIEKRVVAAINLGQGAGISDGSPGGAIFNNSTSSTFPSRITGQYDLYELHTGNYPSDVVRSGAIGGLSADPTIGRVRLLTESESFFPTSGPSTRPGGIPVLFSPYEKHSYMVPATSLAFNTFYSESNPLATLEAYAIDSADVLYACNINTFTSEIEITDDTSSITQPTTFYAYVLKENRSFLSYRLPVLKDYSSGLQTPHLERDRFFAKITPNEDQFKSDYDSKFETAGNYITFGKADNFSYQVARYRQVITLLRKYITSFSAGEAQTSNEPEYNYGSFALIHFKTERAFESLVRDGVAPSDDDVYSRNLLDYSNLNNNLGRSLGTVGGDGLEDGVSSFESSSSMSIFRPNLNFEKRFSGYPQDLVVKTKAKAWGLYPTDQANDLRVHDTYFMWTSGVIYVNPTTWRAYKGHSSTRGGASSTYSSDTQHSRIQTIVEITQKGVQGSDKFSEFDQTEPTNSKPFYTVRPTAQILTSDLTASNNLFAGKFERLEDNTLSEYSISSKHQQVWLTSSGLGGNLSGNVVVIPKGDATKEVSDLSLYDSKDGFCTFTTVGLRPSVMVNKPHRQFQNLGVEFIKDNLNDNSGSTIKKLLYHSARKISLLELYGEKLSPNGTLIADESAISSANDIYTSIDRTKSKVGEDYRSNDNFKYSYIWSDWNNTHQPTQIYSPKSSGQAFSIYRYDEEGYKVYQELELLPIAGIEANGYALELCSGWDWVKNNTGDDVGTVSSGFEYSIKVPVYRPVENTSTRSSDKTHADAKFLAIKGVAYYVECHPSIPYDWATSTNPSGSVQDPTSFAKITEPKSSIEDLGGLTAPDLRLSFSPSLTDAMTNATTYFSLYGFMSTTTSNYGEYVGHNEIIEAGSAEATVNPRLGNTYHLAAITLSSGGSFSVITNVPHPHPTTSVLVNPGGFAVGKRHFGHTIVEVIPTGRRELPEYGNYTMDIRGYITVSGMGNKPSSASYNMHAVDTQTRQPLVSLFTPRKDTQERFLDESYRIEHSLKHIFQDKGDDPDTNYHFGNHTNTSGVSPVGGNTKLMENLIGPGIPNFGDGYNNGYIAFPVRDEPNQSPEGWLSNTSIDLRLYSPHGYAGYLRNNFHTRRVQITNPSIVASDWLEAQVSGFPNMTRNHLSGTKYGTPPRGVLIYPHQNFHGETTTVHGYDLSNSGAGTINPLIDSEAGYYLPNSNAGLSGSDDVANNLAGNYDNFKTWIDDRVGDGGVSQEPFLRHAQPNYNYTATNDLPEVGYLRAFDLNFGKSNERSPHIPYWDVDWTETTTSGDKVDRLSSSATSQGLIESKQWQRVKNSEDGSVNFSTVKMRLVGVDWDMISYVDPHFPTARRDGTVYNIDSKKYLMRKRVMRVFVKVPGLTTWLDVGVMNGEVGESYVQYAGSNVGTSFGIMNENGATSDKTDSRIDGAGCCVSYKETYLVEEGLVALDLELDLGFVPSFKSVGDDSISTTKIASYDDYLGQEKIIYVNNSDRNYIPTSSTDRAWDKGGREAPILVKVILSNPDFPKYEVHPGDGDALINRDNLSDLTVLFDDVYGQSSGNDTIYDIWPSPNKSYRGHSYPPDDRAPTWARRGLMGIEVLRPDGTNFDRDEVIDRPEFASTALFGSQDGTPILNDDDRSHYMVWRESIFKASGYVRGVDALKNDEKTNKQSYVFEDDMLDVGVDIVDTYSLSKKGEG